MLYGWKENAMLTNCLAACAYLSITISEIQRDICEKNRHLIIPPLHSTPPLGRVPVGISAPPLGWKNENGVAIRWLKNFEDMFIRFDVIHERDGQTDGQTLRDSKYRACIASRRKNASPPMQCNTDRTCGSLTLYIS